MDHPRLTIDIIEATRLTREGRLDEAMAILRGQRPRASSGRSSSPSDEIRPSSAGRTDPPIDMMPPRPGSEGVWSAPSLGDASFPRRFGQAETGATLRDLLTGLTQTTIATGLGRGFPEGSDGMSDVLRQSAATGGPVTLPQGARFEEHNYANEAGARPYKLYVPSTYAGQALPLIVMLHGCTQSPDDFAAGTRMNELAEEVGLLVAYPRQTQAANMSKCWNWFNAADQRRDHGEPSILAGITRTILREYAVQDGRVYIAGLSAGGAAAAIMGAAYPDLFAAVGVHSGLACGAAHDMPSAFSAMKQGGGTAGLRGGQSGGLSHPMPTIVFHGDRDTTVALINADEVAAQAMAGRRHRATVSNGQSAAGMAFTRVVQVDDNDRTLLEQWTLHGAGHAWSGGSAAGSYTEPRGPNASREMIRFFLEHATDAGASW